MEFDLSADQVALRDGAADLLAGLSGPTEVRAHLATGAPYDRALWSAMVDQGWPAIAVPEDEGGLGLGWVEAAVLLTELGRHVAPVPLTPVLVALAALVGRPEHADRVAAIVAGESIGAVAWSADPTALVVGGVVHEPTLSGRLGPVEAAAVADLVVVVVPDGVYLVEQPPDRRPAPLPAMDLTRSLSWLDLDHTPAVRLGGPAESVRLTSLGAVASSAELLGGSDRILEMATEYAKDRVQFGAPIGSFQAVKHRCADMLVDVEGIRSTTWYGAWACAADDPGFVAAASTAKVWAADASKRVMSSGLQVHGGIGFTWEHDLHLYLKRAQVAQLAYGDAAHHRRVLAGELRARVRAGEGVM
ncbi:MAG: acyl-CoA/acyl-ACP dehydrogenase [Acidimicrobiales bacterium]|jgi:alkylation response protein AidB-like acyl-CoA dehydrogenase|nr:acyl-CoA/acyl-ACP dehydrogenase [Acidimicrobiales bacterium]